MSKETTDMMLQETVDTQIMGFEPDGDDSGELIVPRVKLLQALSPECEQDGFKAGDIINSLTQEKMNDKLFIPFLKYSNKIYWNPARESDIRVLCSTRTTKGVAVDSDGMVCDCSTCPRIQWNNETNEPPVCTEYINFIGMYEGSPMPIIASFGKTSYYAGKTLYSMAKLSMQSLWNQAYSLTSLQKTGGGNRWYVFNAAYARATTDEERSIGLQLYKQFEKSYMNIQVSE